MSSSGHPDGDLPQPQDFPAGRWRGRWIWSDRSGVGAPGPGNPTGGTLDPDYFDRRVLFRRTFTLDQVPGRAPFRVTADSHYVLYVNGVELARGPIRHGMRQLHYDTGDAASALRPGQNTIAVLARFHGHRTSWWEPTPPTFSLGAGSLVAELRAGANMWITTDETWRYVEATAWTPSHPHTPLSPQVPEIFDARLLDPHWLEPGFDDSGWLAARTIPALNIGGTGDSRPPSEPYGALLPRPIPPLADELRTAEAITVAALNASGARTDDLYECLRADLALAGPPEPVELPVRLDLDDGPRLVVIDFGRIVAGHLRLVLDAEPGTHVEGAVLEVVSRAAFDSAAAFRYITRGTADRHEAADPAGGRFAVLSIRGTGTARLLEASVRERLRPRPSGPFLQCSDPVLEEIYNVGVRSVDLTAQDAYLDCPTREQRAWIGDSVVHQSVDLVANPDWSLARWHPQLASRTRSDGLLPMVAAGDCADPGIITIPDWSLHWIRSVHNLYRYTGDRALVGRLLPAVESVLSWFTSFLGPDGLLHDVTGWVLIDWSPVQVRGTSAALNALWARGLADFADMAEWLGDRYRAEWARELHSAVAKGFDLFWNAGRGAYADHAVDGAVRPAISEHTTAAAVCAGIVPRDRHAEVRRFLLDRDVMFTRSPIGAHGTDSEGIGTSIARFEVPEPDWDVDGLVVGAQPFFRYVVHDALAVLGAADEIAGLCRDWSSLLELNRTSWRECWDGGSFCHGWSATPTRDLVVYVLGVTPAEPGYASVRVAPRLGDLSWARGAVPTPGGLVVVDVRAEADGLRIRVESPVPVEIASRDGTVECHPAGAIDTTIAEHR